MAIFRLGALVTDIVGSIGGTTFKRQGSSLVMMRKSPGASRGRNIQNKRLANNSVIFKSWQFLGYDTQAAWNANAAATKVKNKFGQDINISGVAFQRKCELSGVLVGSSQIDPRTFNTDLQGFSFNSCQINYASPYLNLSLQATSGTAQLVFMAEITLKNLPAPQFTRRGVFYEYAISSTDVIDLYPYLLAKYPFLNGNYNIRIYGYEINPTGWSGVQQHIDVEVV